MKVLKPDQKKEALERKNREILEFTDSAAHDLKKHLTTIKTIFSMMGREYFCKLNGKCSEAVNAGKEAVNCMQELLDDLLICTHFEAGIQQFTVKDIEVNQLVQKVLSRLKYQIEEKGIEVSTHGIDINMNADPKGLTKVFMNLVGNSVNYIGNKSSPKITIGCSVNDNEYEFFVKDNGIGIPQKEQKEIFNKFTRGSNVKGTSGTGLGLSIVKNIVEAHHGKVWLVSKEKQGTTLYFALPKSEDA